MARCHIYIYGHPSIPRFWTDACLLEEQQQQSLFQAISWLRHAAQSLENLLLLPLLLLSPQNSLFHHMFCNVYPRQVGVAFMKQMHTNKTATTYAELQTYVEGWSLPKSLPKLAQLFDEAPARNNLRKDSFTSSASEFLTFDSWLPCRVLASLRF